MDFRRRGLQFSKGIILVAYCVAVFLVAVIVISGVMNGGNTDMTTEMSEATLPIVSFRYGGYEFNRLYGYTKEMDPSHMRDNITPLAEGRKLSIKIDLYGNKINKLLYELRTTDGKRLIENTEVFNYVTGTNTVTADLTLKDLIYADTEYTLCIIIENDKGQNIRYYTKIIDSAELKVAEKLKFAYEFSDTSFDRVKAQTELPTYLESNASGDNSTFSYVDIHSSLNQITWGMLRPERVTDPMATILTIDEDGAVIGLDYFIKTDDDNGIKNYRVNEMYKIRSGSERMFLIDYKRTMQESFSKDTSVLANNKIVLGIIDSNVNKAESPDGNRLAFVNDGRLYTYNITDNKLAYVFGYYEGDVEDLRNTNNKHEIKIFNIDENGNVYFLVYGYMNRGFHEGELGTSIYYYDSVLNTVEEKLYIASNQNYSLLKNDVEKVAYVNSHSQCFLLYSGVLHKINLENGSENKIAENLTINNYVINKDASMIAWIDNGNVSAGNGTDTNANNDNSDNLQDGYGKKIVIYNMDSALPLYVNAEDGVELKPIGFFGNDFIYGEAYEKDICKNISGKTIFPMYKVTIRNMKKVIKEYAEDNAYVVNYSVEDTILNLERASEIYADGTYKEIDSDQILNNSSAETFKNNIEKAVTDKYETIIQITLKKDIDAKKLQILTPKLVLLENKKEISDTDDKNILDSFFVYANGELTGKYQDLSLAVNDAYSNNGLVTCGDGRIIYEKRKRITKNQIMAIKGPAFSTDTPGEDSVAICISTILEYEGISKDVKNDINSGKKAASVLKENLTNATIMDLSGVPLDAVLNYVEKDIPVLAYTDNNKAVLIIGYNEFNTVLMNPENGEVYKYGINDSTELFEKNGNRFFTYMKFVD